jgi:hypothetical protein
LIDHRIINARPSMKRVLFAILWFPVLYCAGCLLAGAVVAAITGSHYPDRIAAGKAAQRVAMKFLADNQVGIVGAAVVLAVFFSGLGSDLYGKIAESRTRNSTTNSYARKKARQARWKKSYAREQARRARLKGEKSARAAGREAGDAARDDAARKAKRAESLDKLYRQAAKLLHPDLSLDANEKQKRHRLMAELNDAYAQCDEDRIHAIIRQWQV